LDEGQIKGQVLFKGDITTSENRVIINVLLENY
jgi:hypothetical protein